MFGYSLVQAYLFLVLLAVLGSAVIQAFWPGKLASSDGWNEARKWQMEIAFWNIGTACGILFDLGRESNSLDQLLLSMIGVWTGLFAVNHHFGTDKRWHIWMGDINIIGCVLSFVLLYSISH